MNRLPSSLLCSAVVSVLLWQQKEIKLFKPARGKIGRREKERRKERKKERFLEGPGSDFQTGLTPLAQAQISRLGCSAKHPSPCQLEEWATDFQKFSIVIFPVKRSTELCSWKLQPI